MFDFSGDHITGFLFAFIPALISIGLVFYIWIFLPKNYLISIFAMLTAAAALWQIDDAMMRIVANEFIADKIDSFLCLSWVFIGPLCLHFAILYTRIIRQRYSRRYLLILYAPTILLTILFETHFYPHDFKYLSFFGWTNFHDNYLLDKLTIFWVSANVIVAVFLLFSYWMSIKHDTLLKAQSKYILIGIAIPAVSGIVTQFILPAIFHQPAFTITSTLMTFFSLATILAMRNYRLFSVSDLVSGMTLIESAPMIIFSSTLQGRITYVNAMGKQILGKKREQFPSIDLLKLFVTPAKKEHEVAAIMQRVIKTKTSEENEQVLLTENGSIDVLLSVAPIINNKKAEGLLFTCRDITETKKQQQALVKQNQELRKINAELDKFVYSVSHDLRAPLTSILGVTEIAKEDTQDPLITERLDLVQSNIQKLDKFILDILDYSKNARQPVSHEQIDFNQMLHDISTHLKNMAAKNKQVEIEWRVNNDHPFYSDRYRVNSVLHNIISNAIRYNDAGKPKVCIQINIEIWENHATITIADNGIGIAKDKQKRIFEMFYRASETSTGSGLGLYIVKETVENLSGNITVASEPGTGSIFTISLPNSKNNF